MSTQVKRPILLQVKSLHEGTSNDQEEPLPRLRPIKTQSLVLPSPTSQTPGSSSLNADFGHHLRQYYSSSKVSNLKSPTTIDDRFSTYSSSSSTSSSTSSSAAAFVETTTTDPPEEPSLILPYLYVGDQAQTQIDTISNLNISYILSLQSLPKFLSNSDESISNSASQPAATTTTTIIVPNNRKEAPRGMSRDHIHRPHHRRSRHSHSKSRLFRQDNVVLFNGVSVQQQVGEKKRQSSSGNDIYDIIDGGDGSLLPSMNSSKDYIVKIKPLDVGDSKVDKKQIIEHVPLESSVLLNSTTQNYDDEDENSSEDFSAHEEETVCDNQLVDQLRSSKTTEPSNKIMDINDDELMNGNDQKIKTKKCPGALLRQTLERRCNKLSSSVHRLIRGKCINISDTFETLVDKFFDETHNFIEEARRNKCNVLVHCKAGISRSPTIAIAYLMKWKRLHLQDAYNFVKRCRPQISPNLNFMGQLVSYERQLQLVGNRCCRPLHFCKSTSQPQSQPIAATTLSRKKTTTSGDELNVPPQA